MTPRASFVMPAYNAERWLSKAIWSCRNQTIKQIEIIVINDGSFDDTRQIIDWHVQEDKRVRGVHLESNMGRSEARNRGNSLADSDLILVLDADDLATNNRVKDTLAVFQLKKPDLVYGSFFTMNSEGVVQDRMVSRAFNLEDAKEKKLNFICHSTVAYTKKLASQIKYESGNWSRLGLDDWKFQWDAYRAGFKLHNIRNPLCYYRVTSDGTMATRDEQAVLAAKEEYLAQV